MPYKNKFSDTLNKRRAYLEVKNKIFTLLGKKCSNCGFDNQAALQIDHVNGGGQAERKKFGRDLRAYYRYVLKQLEAGSKDYQCLCANCNAIKQFHKSWRGEGKG